MNLGPVVNTAGMDGTPRLSPDGFTLYFNSERPGGFGGFFGDIYQAPVIPIVDFTGDYRVDIDDMIIINSVLNPGEGPFSVFAWIKGGAPGQVIVSQAGGMDWLVVDTEQGILKTDLTHVRRGIAGPSLSSPVTVTDDNWHRIGLVWDGMGWDGLDRILYVDDVEVARDTIDTLDVQTVGCISEPGVH